MMKTVNLFFSVPVAMLSFVLLAGCSPSGGELPAETPEKSDGPDKASVTMDAETQARIGLKAEAPAPLDWQPEMKAYGRVLDPAPLTDLLMELGRAEITLDSSHQELERAKKLKADNNISERAFQDIETAYRQNFGAATAAYFKIKSAWGGKMADLTGPIVVPPGTPRKPDPSLDRLLSNGSLIRIDLPPGEPPPAPGQARIEPLAKHEHPITASYLAELPTLDAATQQRGFLFATDAAGTSDRLVPGEAVTAFLKIPGEPVGGVVVPADAVVRHEGRGWLYVQTTTNQFMRTEITLDRLVAGGWFVAGELTATNRIVISGAQALLSTELSGGNLD